MNKRVCAIVVHYRGLFETERCLIGMYQLNPSPANVVVVCNGPSQDQDSSHLAKRFPRLYLLTMRNRGFAAGCNYATLKALQEFNPDLLWYVNPDIVFNRKGIIREVAREASFSNGRICCVKVLYHGVRSMIEWGAHIRVPSDHKRNYIVSGIADKPDYSLIGEVQWVSGSNMMVPVAIVKAIGRLDESYFLYMEDVDYCRRAWKAGYGARYIGVESVYHVSGASSPHKRSYYSNRSDLVYNLRHKPLRGALLLYRRAHAVLYRSESALSRRDLITTIGYVADVLYRVTVGRMIEIAYNKIFKWKIRRALAAFRVQSSC